MAEITDADGRVRRTDAKRSDLDTFDAILLQDAVAKGMNEPEQVSDYPENVLDTLRIFNKVFMLPHRAIPRKILKGRFSQWVQELEEINEICGVYVEEAMKISLSNYESMRNRFPISHPSAIRSLLITAMSEIKRKKSKEEEKRGKEEENIKEKAPLVIANKAIVKSRLNQLKSDMKKDEE